MLTMAHHRLCIEAEALINMWALMTVLAMTPTGS